MRRTREFSKFHKTILASEAEADRGEVISHERLERESKKWVKSATRRKNLEEFRQAIRVSMAQANRSEVVSHKQAIKVSKRWVKKTAK